MGDPHDISPRGSWHLSGTNMRAGTGHRKMIGRAGLYPDQQAHDGIERAPPRPGGELLTRWPERGGATMRC